MTRQRLVYGRRGNGGRPGFSFTKKRCPLCGDEFGTNVFDRHVINCPTEPLEQEAQKALRAKRRGRGRA